MKSGLKRTSLEIFRRRSTGRSSRGLPTSMVCHFLRTSHSNRSTRLCVPIAAWMPRALSASSVSPYATPRGARDGSPRP